jgi:autoinducer 2-degrading protein
VSKPTCAVHVVFNIKPEHAQAFHQAVLRQAENSLSKEAWCHQFDVGTDPERPHSFLLYETYDDRDAFVNQHRQTEHFADFNRTVADWIESKEVSVWDIGGTT